MVVICDGYVICFIRLRHRGVLIGRDGPDNNVLKIKPPMVISKEDIDYFIRELDYVLQEIHQE